MLKPSASGFILTILILVFASVDGNLLGLKPSQLGEGCGMCNLKCFGGGWKNCIKDSEICGVEHNIACCTNCIACNSFGRDAPTLYSEQFIDGGGVWVKHILRSMHFAFEMGFNYGGSVGSKMTNMTGKHDVRFSALFNFLFGLDRLSLLGVDELPKNAMTFESPKEVIEANRDHKIKSNAIVYVKSTPASNSIRPGFTELLLQGAQCGLAVYRNYLAWPRDAALRVAVHIRRGDIEPNNDHFQNWIPNEVYVDIIKETRRLVPDASFQLFSSIEEKLLGRSYWTRSEDFDVFREMGVTVHLDIAQAGKVDKTNDTLLAWSHFIESDVLIAGPTSFAKAPEHWVQGCIVSAKKKKSRLDEKEINCISKKASKESSDSPKPMLSNQKGSDPPSGKLKERVHETGHKGHRRKSKYSKRQHENAEPLNRILSPDQLDYPNPALRQLRMRGSHETQWKGNESQQYPT